MAVGSGTPLPQASWVLASIARYKGGHVIINAQTAKTLCSWPAAPQMPGRPFPASLNEGPHCAQGQASPSEPPPQLATAHTSPGRWAGHHVYFRSSAGLALSRLVFAGAPRTLWLGRAEAWGDLEVDEERQKVPSAALHHILSPRL